MWKTYWLNYKSISLFFFFLFSFPLALNAEFETFSSDNFLVQGDSSYETLREWGFLAEERRREIAHELGFFYVGPWDPPCSLLIASNRKSFLKVSGAPKWAQGWATLEVHPVRSGHVLVERQIWVFPQKKKEREPVLSHEIAHQLFREFLGYSQEIPLWLDEGVAIWAEKKSRSAYRRTIYKAVKKNKVIPLPQFFSLTRYPADKRLFYSQSSSIIRFLLQEYGTAEFQRFSRLIRDGESFDSALAHIYGARSSDLQEFEQRWKKFVLKK